ncbi:MAG: helix-turn-helix domain-containing protein [Gaiellaceae bacterium]
MQTQYANERLAPLSIDESAQVLGVSRATLYRIIRAGDLRPTRVGARARFELQDLRDYIERRRSVGEGVSTSD